MVAEFERLRAQTDAQANRALEDMRNRVSGVSQEVTQHLDSITNRFSETSDDLRARAARTASEMQMEQGRFRAEAERLPIAARESADAMRMALSEQLRALEQLSTLSTRQRRDVIAPGPLPAGAPGSLTAAYAAQAGPLQVPPPPAGDDDGGWSLTDLLSRASRDDDGTERPPVVDMEIMARGLDPDDGCRHLVALPRRPARYHGAQHLYGGGHARPSTTSPSATRPTWTCAAPSTVSSPISRA